MHTIDEKEIDKFQKMADEWWSVDGKFKPLHQLNHCRLQFMRSHIAEHFGKTEQDRKPFSGLKLLDVGCGGGLISEPMARLGAEVTAIDASEKTIEVAKAHLRESDVEVDYRFCDIESLESGLQDFDIVLALEIVEHVSDLGFFLESVSLRVKQGGLLIISTLNRTAKSYIFGIIAAEYILRLLPRGTHEWEKFVRPSELIEPLGAHGLRPIEMCGMGFDVIRQSFSLRPRDLSVNYIGLFIKD